MTEKRNTKGFVGLIIAGVLSLIVALGALGFFQFYQTADNLYKQGKIFGEVPMKDEAVAAVKITNYAKTPIGTIDGGTELYLIEFTKSNDDDFGYASIEVKEGDKLIEKLKSTDDLLATPVIVAAKIRKSGADGAIRNYTSLLKDTIKNDKNVLQRAEKEYYVSVYEFDKDRQFAYIVAGIAGIIALVFFYSAFATRKGEDKAYNELYSAYPELNYSMDTVLENATYVDNQLGIVLYKHHLLATYKNFQVYDLTKAERIYHYVYTQKSYGMTVSRTSQLIVLTNDKSYRRKKTSLLIKNVGDETDDLLQPFFYAVSQEFPDILLGYENKSKRPF
mgnify:CR=1 FL=1